MCLHTAVCVYTVCAVYARVGDTLAPTLNCHSPAPPGLRPAQQIVAATNKVLLAAGPRGHILNVGHGVPQGTPESAVGVFCEAARQSGTLFAAHGQAKKKLVAA